MTKQQIKELIAENRTAEAIKALKELTIQKDQLYNELLIVESQFKSFQSNSRAGTDRTDNLGVAQSQINQSLLQITDQAFIKAKNAAAKGAEKVDFRQVQYAVRHTLKQFFRRPAQHLFVVVLIILAVVSLLNIPALFLENVPWPQWPAYRPWILLLSLGLILIWLGLRIQKILKQSNQHLQLQYISNSPIKGLRSFGFEDAEVFKSLQRRAYIETCLTGIIQQDFRFGILTGDSGSGKTSFIRAGLHAALEENNLECVVVKCQNEPPLDSVKRALPKQLPGLVYNGHPDSLSDYLSAALPKTQSGTLVLILDQFEQFFTHQKTAEDRLVFIQQLKQCYQELPEVKILISLRRDFAGRLHEVQRILGYFLSADYNYFDVEKFTPQQAAAIFQVMAAAERIECDHAFIEQMCREELAASEDGLISAVDIQVLAFIVKGQPHENKAFTQSAFQRLGGIEGLLHRFLREQVETPNIYNTNQAALKVLLGFIDLDNNVRIGELTIDELHQRLLDDQIAISLPAILVWLEELRLITKTLGPDQIPKYELAHERLILPLCNLAGRTLDEVEKANQILNKRTNEWLANGRQARFLPNWREYRQIRQQQKQHRIRWGKNGDWKEKLLLAARRKFLLRLVTVFLPLLLLGGWLTLKQSSWYLFKYEVPKTFRAVLFALSSEDQMAIVDSLAGVDPVFLYEITPGFRDSTVIDRAYFALVKNWTDSLWIDSTKILPAEALAAAAGIKNANYQSDAFYYIAQSAGQIGDTVTAYDYLRQSVSAASGIESAISKSYTLRDIAQAAVQIGDTVAAYDYLQHSVTTVTGIGSANDKLYALLSIAQAAVQIGDTVSLQQLVAAMSGIESASSKSDVFRDIAQTAVQVGDTVGAYHYLRQSVAVASGIESASSKSDVFRDIAQTAVQIGDTVGAYDYLRQSVVAVVEAESVGYKSSALRYIAQIAVQIGDTVGAYDYLRQSVAAASEIEDFGSRSFIPCDIAQAAVQIGDTVSLRQSVAATSGIGNASGKFYALSCIAQAAIQIGDTVGAYDYLRQSVAAASEIESASSKSAALRNIAQAAIQIGDTVAAYDHLLQSVATVAEIESASSKSVGLRDIFQAAVQIGDTVGAYDYLRQLVVAASEIESASSKSDVVRDIAQIAIQLGDTVSLRQSVVAASGIKDAFYKSSALRYIAKAAGQIADTIALRQLVAAAAVIEDASFKSYALRDIAQAAVQLGDTFALRQSVTTVSGIENASSKSFAFRYMAQAAGQSGAKRLLDIIHNYTTVISGAVYQSTIQERLVIAYLQCGAKREALKLAQSMPLNNKDKAWAYLNLMKAWREGKGYQPMWLK